MLKNYKNTIFWASNRISNWFLVRDYKLGDIIIDTGAPIAYPKIKLICKLYKFKPRYVLLTHGHADHAGNMHKLARDYKAKVVCHKFEKPYIINEIKRPKRDYSGINPFGRIIQFGDMLFGDPIYKKVLSYEEVPEIHERFSFHLMQGHTLGSVIIKHIETQSIFLGDTLHNERAIYLYPKRELVYPYPYFCENHTQAIQNLQQLKSIAFDHAFFGHGAPMINEARENIIKFLN